MALLPLVFIALLVLAIIGRVGWGQAVVVFLLVVAVLWLVGVV